MSKTCSLFSVVFFFYSSYVSGQNKTYFGIEAAGTNSLYTIGGDDFIIPPLWSLQAGVSLGYELNKNFTLETGAIRNYGSFGYEYAQRDAFDLKLQIFNSWQFPLRLKTNLNLYKEKLYFTLNNGLVICRNDLYNGAALGVSSYRPDTIRTFFVARSKVRNFPLLQTGAGFELKFRKNILLGVSANYYAGMIKVYETRIDYRKNNKSEKTTYATSKGDYWNIACSLRYPISNFWQK